MSVSPPGPWPPTEFPAVVQATSVNLLGRGVLMIGPSGSGKSSLALQMMALGADLIADDLTQLRLTQGRIWLFYPPQSPKHAKIEARFFGILDADHSEPAPLTLLIDMAQTETERLPEPRHVDFGDISVRCIRKVDNPAFPAMVLQYLTHARG